MALIEYSNLGERSCGPERRNREDSAERTTVVRRGVAGGRGRVGAPPPRPQRELPQALGERGDDLRQLGERLGRDLGPFWTAARMVVDVAANLPSFRAGDESPADSAVCGEVAGNVDAVAGCGAEPEAELTFTMTDGRSVTLILSDEQCWDLNSRIHSLSKYVWSEYEQEDEESEEESAAVELPDVSEIEAGPDTGHELITVLEQRFGVTEDFMMAHTCGAHLHRRQSFRAADSIISRWVLIYTRVKLGPNGGPPWPPRRETGPDRGTGISDAGVMLARRT